MRVLLLCVLAGLAAAEWKRYDGYSVIEVVPQNPAQNEALRNMAVERPELDFWREPTKMMTPVQIMVSRQGFPSLKHQIQQLDLTAEVVVDNVQSLLTKEASQIVDKETFNFDYNVWNDYNTFMTEIRQMAADCPADFTCDVQTIGQSHEGRNIDVLVINTGNPTGVSFWVDSLIHAREWLAGATTMNVFNRLIREYDSNAEAQAIVDRYETIYFLPIMNPDGYAFSWDSDRLWRKNRRQNNNCMGVDLNRNYDWVWGQVDGGSSPLECSDLYRGPTAASEPETQAVSTYTQGLIASGVQFETFLTFHTFGYYWLVPFGDCSDPPNGPATLQVADDTARAIEAEPSGTDAWADGNSCRVLYATDGGSSDWAQGVLGAEYVYTPELRGPYFTPGVDAIPPSFSEIWAGLVEMFQSIDRQKQ